jgi:hypothetical protein
MKRLCVMMLGFSMLAGCGYTTQGMLDPSYKTVYVKPVINKINTTEETKVGAGVRTVPPQIENRFTAALRDRMLRDGNLKSVSQDTADLILEVTITDYAREGMRYDDNKKINEQRLKINYDYVLKNAAGEDVNKGSLIADELYANTGTNARSEDAAMRELLDDAGRRVVQDIVEAW